MTFTWNLACRYGNTVFWQFENSELCVYLLSYCGNKGHLSDGEHYKCNRWIMFKDKEGKIWAKEAKNYERPFMPQPEFQSMLGWKDLIKSYEPSYWERTGLFSATFHEGKIEYDENKMKLAKLETDTWQRACENQARAIDKAFGESEERIEKQAEEQGFKYGFGNHFLFEDEEIFHYIETGQWIPLDDFKGKMLYDKIPEADFDLEKFGYRKLTGGKDYLKKEYPHRQENALAAVLSHGSDNDIWHEDAGMDLELSLLGEKFLRSKTKHEIGQLSIDLMRLISYLVAIAMFIAFCWFIHWTGTPAT